MASSSASERNKRIQGVVERAKRSAAEPVRRDAFQELIELTHSNHPVLKSYAAAHIHVFFKEFPDLEEDAINAVYDLCEDQDPNVRKDGYHAVTQVSFAEHKWVKRNADVLVQLLQSDEPEEVAVVKLALLNHLEMEFSVTLGVLCDQIVATEDDPDDDERQTRERLRSLVLSFLATEAMSAIQKHTDPPGSAAERAFVTQLITAANKLDASDVAIILRDVLLRLERYRSDSGGDELLQVILDEALTLLHTRSNDPMQLKGALHYLSVAQIATVDLHAAPAVKLLQFYTGSLTRKLVLQKFLPEDRIQLISWIMDTLCVSERETATQPQQIAQLRRKIVEASSILLEVLFDTKLYGDNLWRSMKSILLAINTRKELDNWILPSYLVTSISKFQELSAQANDSEIQGLIRLLAEPLPPPAPAPAPTPVVKSVVKNGIPLDRPAHLPQRPVTSLPPMSTPLDHLPMAFTAITAQQPLIRDNSSRLLRIASMPTSPKRPLSASDEVPQTKRVRVNWGGQDDSAPSLLSRIADAGEANSGGYKKRRRRFGKEVSPELEPEPDRHPSIGYSIKGAASAKRNGSGGLLDRMGREGSV